MGTYYWAVYVLVPTVESANESNTASWCPERYEILELIGQGGMGRVYRANDGMLHRVVAIKFLEFESADGKSHERFLREAKALALLDHPNIVSVFGSGINEQGQPYFVMEFLEGVSLASELSAGPLSAARFYEVFSDVLAGLANAHANKIAHRDLKPSNIFRGKNSEGRDVYKIIDFGIARIDSDASEKSNTLTATSMAVGSPTYMSPEQCAGRRANALSDIYSLGCIMYECIAGVVPFQGDSPMELMYKHLNEMPPQLDTKAKSPASKQLAALISSCMAKQPDKRPQTVEQVSNTINELFNESNLNKLDLFSHKAKAQKDGAPLAVLVAVCLLVLSGIVFFAFSSRQSPSQSKPLPVKFDRNAKDIASLRARSRKSLSELFALGRIELRSKSKDDIADAQKVYSEALEQCKDNGRYPEKKAACLALRAEAEWRLGKGEDAEKDYKKAIEVAIKHHETQQYHDVLYLRTLYELHVNRLGDAYKDFSEASSTGFEPNDALDMPSRMDKVENFASHLDALGDTRLDLIENTASELEKYKPHSEAERKNILQLADVVADILGRIEYHQELQVLRDYMKRISTMKITEGTSS